MNVLWAHLEEQLFSSPNEITILDDLEEFIRQHLDARYASAQLFNPALKNLHLVAYRGFAKALMDQFDDVPITSGTTCARAARHRVPILVPDVTTDAERLFNPSGLKVRDCRAQLRGVPHPGSIFCPQFTPSQPLAV